MIDRREKKCVLGAVLLHAVLLLVLVFGPGFLSSKPLALPLLDYIPDEIVDAVLHGGGNPRVTTPPAPPPPAPPKAVVTPPPRAKAQEPEPEPPKPLPKVNPIKVPETKKAPPKPAPKVAKVPTKTTPKISTRLVTKNADQITKQREAERKAALKAAADRARLLEQTRKSISRNLSEKVSVEVSGPGGRSVANWAQVVHSIYDRAWIEPGSATDGRATARATITIARDGSIISASLTGPSGKAALDKSVRNVLDRVRNVPAFPAGAHEDRRTVTIKFNLLSQRLPG